MIFLTREINNLKEIVRHFFLLIKSHIFGWEGCKPSLSLNIQLVERVKVPSCPTFESFILWQTIPSEFKQSLFLSIIVHFIIGIHKFYLFGPCLAAEVFKHLQLEDTEFSFNLK